jgi:hypothetical protein
LTAAINALGTNGTTDLIAQVLEASGTPPHSGTLVTFTTTLGTIEPAEARTDVGGRVVVKFHAGTANGTATIVATSGGATTGSDGAVKIAIGTAAVGNVGLTANPNPISANGGVATIIAFVRDVNGNPLVAAPVNFSTSAGSLSNAFVNTDQSGLAQTQLTTSVTATVTATVGVQSTGGTGGGGGSDTPGTGTGGGSTSGQASATVTVNVNPIPTVAIKPPAGTITANSPVTFTYTANPGTNSTAQIREVIVNWGDGETQNLGAASGTDIPIQHRFRNDGTFVVRLTVRDTLGGETAAATSVVVQPEPPLNVTISVSTTPQGLNTIYTFTATVIPATETVVSYIWSIDGSFAQQTSNNQFIRTFPTGEVHTISVLITTSTGRQATGVRVIP